MKDERKLVQFAGLIFTFPLTEEQLHTYLADPKRHAFRIIHNNTNTTIGHCEVYEMEEQNSKLCRILIGDKKFRGRGYRKLLTKLLTDWSFSNLYSHFISLNVYDFNTFAIKSYERIGFKITATNETKVQVNHELWTSYRMMIDRETFYKKAHS